MPKQTLIACIDDEMSVAESIEGLLKASGFEVAMFSSAEAFLTSEIMDQASCLITDVKLGGMSGLQLQDRLLELGVRIPTIVITAYPDDRTRDQALGGGAVCFLGKPVLATQLLNWVDEALKPM